MSGGLGRILANKRITLVDEPVGCSAAIVQGRVGDVLQLVHDSLYLTLGQIEVSVTSADVRTKAVFEQGLAKISLHVFAVGVVPAYTTGILPAKQLDDSLLQLVLGELAFLDCEVSVHIDS